MYIMVRLESVELETGSGESGLHKLIKTDPIIPSVDDSGDGEGRLYLNVTTNSTLSTNMFYNATLDHHHPGHDGGWKHSAL